MAMRCRTPGIRSAARLSGMLAHEKSAAMLALRGMLKGNPLRNKPKTKMITDLVMIFRTSSPPVAPTAARLEKLRETATDRRAHV